MQHTVLSVAGLKGSLNEYELDLLRQRSVEARREKAKRGELIVASPAGFVKGEDRLEKDPDRRVQERVLLVFGKFFELGSARQTLLWFLEHGLQVPVSAPRDQSSRQPFAPPVIRCRLPCAVGRDHGWRSHRTFERSAYGAKPAESQG